MTEQTTDYDYVPNLRDDIYKASNIPAIYLNTDIALYPEDCDIEAFQLLKKIQDQCIRFVKERRNLNLYSSRVGNGKTTWAVKIMKNFIDTFACVYDSDCLFISVPEFILLSKNFSDEAQQRYNSLKTRAMTARLVIFDEIASKHSTEFDELTFHTIISHRIYSGKSTIYTSNVLPQDLKKLLGERIADRITGSNTINIELKGGSRRDTTF